MKTPNLVSLVKFERGTVAFSEVPVNTFCRFEDGDIYLKTSQESVEICGSGVGVRVNKDGTILLGSVQEAILNNIRVHLPVE